MAAPRPSPITDARQLLVDGRDPYAFFIAMLNGIGLTGVQVQNYEERAHLRGFLKALRREANFFALVQWLGIVQDAENNPAGAFASVCSALVAAGLPVPAQPLQKTGSNPRTSVFILPGANSTGMLETLCLNAIAQDPVVPCVEEFFDCVQKQNVTLPQNMEKAKVHAFLASRPTPDLLVGEAASAGYFPWGSSAFDEVKQFLYAFGSPP